ncbi:unnamed protein product [Clavelina lepadiformis]|uniref:Lysosomal-associated transmembrane protein 4A n=1 Tax=Clavelina lepadiformis TaxID=159417 RepID=A0ABP0H3J0_CLALP
MRSERPTCCCCLHVKVGTFMLAVLFMVGGFVSIVMSSLLLSNAVQPESFFPDDMAEDDVYQYWHTHKRSTLWFGLGNGVFITLISSLSIYGLVKNRPGFLLPLFIVQVFNFLCTIVYIGSLMFYWPNVKINILECRHMPQEWKDWFLSIDDRWLAVIVFSILFVVLFIKSYLISMVYRCYKDITTQALRLQRDPEISFVADPGNGPIYKPPKYEDIQKVPLVSDVEAVDYKPPPYSA